MLSTFNPQSLAKRWNTSAESVLNLIRTKKLRAFTLSPAGSKRPRWKVSADAVAEFEAGQTTTSVAKPQRRQKQPAGIIQFY